MNIVTGVFNSVDRAKEAFHTLEQAGFDHGNIGLVVCDQGKGTALSSDMHREFRRDDTPGSLMGNAVFCHLSDRYMDNIRKSNLPDDAIDWYQMHLDRGDILVIAQVGERMQDVERIMHDHGGILYKESFGEERATTTTRPMARETRTTEATANTVFVPIIEEEVFVEKATHQTGQAEVASMTTEETVDVPTTVMHEVVRVERRKLDHPMSVDEYREKVHTESGTVRMPVVEEELQVMKRPVIREEMVIIRTPVQETKTVHEEVQHTEPHVETKGDVHVEGEEKGKRRPAA